MSQSLNLSRAARLAGVSRGELQKKIRKGELSTFEGEVLVSDLLRIYPTVELENNEMLERVSLIRELAQPKTDLSDGALPIPPVIRTRLEKLNAALGQTKSALFGLENLISETVERLQVLAGREGLVDAKEIAALAKWLEAASVAGSQRMDQRARFFAKDAFLRVMAASVKVIPSGHEFFVEGTESILDASLRAGLHFNYGCTSGNCGSCKARVVSGEVWKTRQSDYVISEAEQSMGYILTCCNTAVTDIVLEASEAASAADLPRQDIIAGLNRVEPLSTDYLRLLLKTPRTSRLRFLAGQRVSLRLAGGETIELPIASCPCNGRNLEFFVRQNPADAFFNALPSKAGPEDKVSVSGPFGDFVLDDDSTSPLLLVAIGAGIAPIKSLAEHAISIDHVESLHLYWITAMEEGSYIDRLCRSWSDSLDNFRYTRVEDHKGILEAVEQIAEAHPGLDRFDLRIAGAGSEVETGREALSRQGIVNDRIRAEVVS